VGGEGGLARTTKQKSGGIVAKQKMTERRAIIAGLGAVATAGALGGRSVQAQESADPFTPMLHREDAWMSAMGGKHRVVVDVTSPDGVPEAIRFTGNLLMGHKNWWGVEESEVAIIMCLRHGATAFGYTDAIWSKYGKTIDPRATPAPTANPYNSGERSAFADLATRGVQFMVCGTASRGLAGRIAGPSGDTDAVLKEMGANLISSARIVPSGVVAMVHAQERRFALVSVG
jgi:intracellular sulfur oxidation DsrE/DsrF family protein